MSYLKLGIDVGSTTIKIIALDNLGRITYSDYKRHYSDIKTTLKEVLIDLFNVINDSNVKVTITGSGGIAVSEWLNCTFEQEVIACTKAVQEYLPQTDVVIELGG